MAHDEHPTASAGTGAADARLPLDPRTGQPIEPRAQPGYYPGFSTLAQQNF